jgi:hypothetical protein
MANRGLTPLEEAEARTVFADALTYPRVRVIEDARWANAFPRLLARLAGDPPPALDNAVALGHRLHFPRRLRTTASSLAEGDLGDFAWLIHELAHVWQVERIGLRFAWQAIRLHLSRGEQVYRYGGEAAVVAATEAGANLAAFNVEQQAEIARDYYIRCKVGKPAGAWVPLAADFRMRPAVALGPPPARNA